MQILENASGSGFGAGLLSGPAELVVGGDRSEDAVRYAQAYHRRDNLIFLSYDVQALPFMDEVFDLVTAFEIIEHLHEPTSLVRELRRVLRPGGEAILSTPIAGNLGDPVFHPFHVRTYSPDEFRACLREAFDVVRLYGICWPEGMSPPGKKTWLRAFVIRVKRALGLTRPLLPQVMWNARRRLAEASAAELHELIEIREECFDRATAMVALCS
jgi:SAM-dependent methyltransferase